MAPPKVPLTPRPDQCPIGRRCHPSGKQLLTFGTKFGRAMVRDLAASSVLIGGPDVFRNDVSTFVASGTLVQDNIVLCAAHSIQTFSDKDIQIFMFFECDEKTAPAGNNSQYKTDADFLKCNIVRPTTKAIAKGVKTIERGSSPGLDYALLAIEWTDFTMDNTTGQKVVTVPRFPITSSASRSFSSEVLLIGHPNEQPTQASAGTLLKQFGPDPATKTGIDYAYANFAATSGSSGGGVFNESGEIIGVLKGILAGEGIAFLNLGQVADQLPKSRIARWLAQQGDGPVFAGDPKETVRFQVRP